MFWTMWGVQKIPSRTRLALWKKVWSTSRECVITSKDPIFIFSKICTRNGTVEFLDVRTTMYMRESRKDPIGPSMFVSVIVVVTLCDFMGKIGTGMLGGTTTKGQCRDTCNPKCVRCVTYRTRNWNKALMDSSRLRRSTPDVALATGHARTCKAPWRENAWRISCRLQTLRLAPNTHEHRPSARLTGPWRRKSHSRLHEF